MSAEHDTTYAGAIVKSVSIENLLQQRDGVIERIQGAIAMLLDAQELARAARIADGDRYRDFAYLLQGKDHYQRTDLLNPEAMAGIRKRIDSGAWNYLMHESGLLTFMDSKAREEWRKKIDDCDTPELTAANIRSTFGMLYDTRGDMFERGVIRCFKNLSWNYKTNQPFKFGRRVIVYVKSYGNFDYAKLDQIADLQRVFCIIDGKPEEDHRSGVASRLRDAERGRQPLQIVRAGVLDDIYMHFRWFKNGNAHITFKRQELVDKMNQILAKHFPGALAYDHRSAS